MSEPEWEEMPNPGTPTVASGPACGTALWETAAISPSTGVRRHLTPHLLTRWVFHNGAHRPVCPGVPRGAEACTPVAHLASPAAASTTSTSLTVDGGMDGLRPRTDS